MQKITREQLIEKASALLSNSTVSCVLGWGMGEFDYDVTPTTFSSVEELEKGFVFGDFFFAFFSKYLVSKTQKVEGKILVFLKPCDTYSFNQLLTEHRFDREKVYVVGIPCDLFPECFRIVCCKGDSVCYISACDSCVPDIYYTNFKERRIAVSQYRRIDEIVHKGYLCCCNYALHSIWSACSVWNQSRRGV